MWMTCPSPLKSAALVLLLAGCVGVPEGYPSLSVRPEESLSPFTPIPDQTTASPPAGSSLQGRLGALAAQATEGAAAFDRQIATTERDIGAAHGSAVDSEAWTVAQQSVSRADAALVLSAAALAEADRLLADLRLSAAEAPDTPGLAEASSTRSAIAAAHQTRVERLDAARVRLR